MTEPDDHRCRPIFDDAGELIAVARVGDLDERGEQALRDVIAAAKRLHEATDTPERRAAYEAGQARIRKRNARLRGGGDLPGVDHDP